MGSYDAGKPFVCDWIRANFPKDATILDVGVSDGKWRLLLKDYPNIDGVEVFEPNARRSRHLYRHMYVTDICDFRFDFYDLIIFGDVIEHIDVHRAQKVLEYARPRCTDMVIAVPFLYPQGMEYGNPYEEHLQDDLTREIFSQRYPGHETLFYEPELNYCYYHKGKT